MSDPESGYKPRFEQGELSRRVRSDDEVGIQQNTEHAKDTKQKARDSYNATIDFIINNLGSSISTKFELADKKIIALEKELASIQDRDPRIADLRMRLLDQFAQSNTAHDWLMETRGEAYQQQYEAANEAIRQTLEELRAVFNDGSLDFSDRLSLFTI
jgi:sugar (pentulose or hexulose) kinase